MTILNEAKANGTLDIIKNDSIRLKLYELIPTYEALREREKLANTDLNSFFKPFLDENHSIRNLFSLGGNKKIKKSSLSKINYSYLLTSREFENLIITRIYYYQDTKDTYIDFLNKLKSCKKHISKALHND